jgi:hypothetical protein
MLLLLAGGYMIHRPSSTEEAPPREFTELEFAANDAAHTGTCYSLGTVLIANGAFSDAVRTWTRDEADEHKWTLRLEQVVQDHNGPAALVQDFTFEKSGEQVRLVKVAATAGQSTDPATHVDRLLTAPRDLRSTRVERCLKGGAGYESRAR